jgi:hypothetical protein
MDLGCRGILPISFITFVLSFLVTVSCHVLLHTYVNILSFASSLGHYDVGSCF